jgi:hypothetical protein
MGRNPAVGRQGPAHYAATIPSEDAAQVLAVKQIRSEIADCPGAEHGFGSGHVDQSAAPG